MPPKARITKADIVEAALELVRQNGEQAINARSIASALNCSTQPVFSNFTSMEELRAAVKDAANALYQSYLDTDMASGEYPPYKASGRAYIRFAQEERELFKLLFMCDRSNKKIDEDRETIRPLMELIQENLGFSEDEAFMFHMEMWIYVHGIATMIATSYLNWDDEYISRLLSDAYMGMKKHYLEEKRDAGNSNHESAKGI